LDGKAPFPTKEGAPEVRKFGPRTSLLRVGDVAQLFGVHRATVYKACKEGRLGHFRISGAIRVPEEALRAYLAALFQIPGSQ
jgi:excisionase family DNA binding protein